MGSCPDGMGASVMSRWFPKQIGAVVGRGPVIDLLWGTADGENSVATSASPVRAHGRQVGILGASQLTPVIPRAWASPVAERQPEPLPYCDCKERVGNGLRSSTNLAPMLGRGRFAGSANAQPQWQEGVTDLICRFDPSGGRSASGESMSSYT